MTREQAVDVLRAKDMVTRSLGAFAEKALAGGYLAHDLVGAIQAKFDDDPCILTARGIVLGYAEALKAIKTPSAN